MMDFREQREGADEDRIEPQQDYGERFHARPLPVSFEPLGMLPLNLNSFRSPAIRPCSWLLVSRRLLWYGALRGCVESGHAPAAQDHVVEMTEKKD